MSSSVPTRLSGVLADVFGATPEAITLETAVGKLEGWDSFGHLQAVLALESEFGVQFDPAKIPELTSVAKLKAYLEAKGVAWE
jgi:acyl carrier protein